MALVLDTGALIAIERGNRNVRAALSRARAGKSPVRVGAGVVAQVWRGGQGQANLARVLHGVDVVTMDDDAAREIGELLGVTGRSDVVDAHCALLVRTGDIVVTSDPKDIRQLLFARGVRARIEVV